MTAVALTRTSPRLGQAPANGSNKGKAAAIEVRYRAIGAISQVEQMKWRKVIMLLGGAATWRVTARTQQSTRRVAVLIVAVLMMVAATLGANAQAAQESSTVVSPQAQQEIAQVEAEIDRIEAETIERLAAPPDNQVQQLELLGKLLLYDKQLSVNRNQACAFCHMPETGFTGPVSELNRTTGSYPGSVRTRFSDRKPQSHAYAPLSPVLH